MSGVSVIYQALTGNASFVATIPATRIFAGPIPEDAVLPAVSIVSISGVPRNTVSMAERVRMVSERVRVVVHAKIYDDVGTVLELARLACPLKPTVTGVDLDSILPDIVGPDIHYEDTDLHEQSRDFLVRWRTA